MSSIDNKRIAKNTIFLYIRMILVILVNIYTVRVIWDILGVEDYGVYNVVGGVIMMFAFLNNAMVASSQRFISYELGTGNSDRLNKVFSISVSVHFILAVIIFLLGETVGLWFVNNKLNIPLARIDAANWVYQCTIVAFIFNVISIPYTACIVAHEHMKAYGYLGILEVILKLIIVLLLIIIPGDKLITYALLLVCVSGVMRIMYGIYCFKKFPECKFHFYADKILTKEMFSFAGWSFVGNIGFSVKEQGLNLILNLFFNVLINAAKGIATQIGNVLAGFAQNFQMAINPQITKRFASGNSKDMMNLVVSGCKFSCLLMIIMIIPFYFACGKILRIWLEDVAPYTIEFLKLTLIVILVDAISAPVTTSLQAIGRIKWFQIVVSLIMLSNLPLAWVWLKLNHNPLVVMYVSILTSLLALSVRIYLLNREIKFSYINFIGRVFLKLIPLALISVIATGYIYTLIGDTVMQLIIYFLSSVLITLLTAYYIVLDKVDRNDVCKTIKQHFANRLLGK